MATTKKKAPAKKAPAKKTTAKKTPAARKPPVAAAPKPKKKTAAAAIDIAEMFPHELLREESRWICLACILDVFTRHLGLTAAAAMKSIRAHKPGVDELTAHTPERPYFERPAADGACPHCHSPAKWHAKLRVFRVEGGKATDAAGYIRESILEPNAHLVAGPTYSSNGQSMMPTGFGQSLEPAKIDALVAYLMTLK